jgi:ribonuclease HI
MRGVLWFDGASRGNPGPGGAGAVLDLDGERVRIALPLPGRVTNNEAEYQGLIAGLREALARGATELEARGDSQLVVRQMQGSYIVRAANLRPLHDEARALAKRLRVTWRHVPRAENAEADAEANRAADRAQAGKP